MVRASQERIAEQQLHVLTTAPSNQRSTRSPETRQIRREPPTVKKLREEPHHPTTNGKRLATEN